MKHKEPLFIKRMRKQREAKLTLQYAPGRANPKSAKNTRRESKRKCNITARTGGMQHHRRGGMQHHCQDRRNATSLPGQEEDRRPDHDSPQIFSLQSEFARMFLGFCGRRGCSKEQ
eukprot:1147992-Pelagomonas_calceolata.AAC.11